MTKNMEQAITENYPDFNPFIHCIIVNDGDGTASYLRRDLWPSELGTAPTDEQLETWMSE